MQRGLEGRRVALYVAALTDPSGVGLQQALERAGARVHVLTDDTGADEFRGGVYAALVATATAASDHAPILQLVREFMASDKPVAAKGEGIDLIVRAGGAAGRRLVAGARRAELESAGATPSDRAIEVDEAVVTAAASVSDEEFAASVVRTFSHRLDESAVDEMSELSFPASDPPAVSPSSAGHTTARNPGTDFTT